MALALLLKINYQDEHRPEEEGGGREGGRRELLVEVGACRENDDDEEEEKERIARIEGNGGGGSRSKEEKEPRHEGREARASFGTGPSSPLVAQESRTQDAARCESALFEKFDGKREAIGFSKCFPENFVGNDFTQLG